MSTRVPEFPRQLITDTDELLSTLDETVANLRAFTQKLREATAASKKEA